MWLGEGVGPRQELQSSRGQLQPLSGSYRRKLHDMVHEEKYDRAKMMSNEDVLNYLYMLRKSTIRTYVRSRGDNKLPNPPADRSVAVKSSTTSKAA